MNEHSNGNEGISVTLTEERLNCLIDMAFVAGTAAVHDEIDKFSAGRTLVRQWEADFQFTHNVAKAQLAAKAKCLRWIAFIAGLVETE